MNSALFSNSFFFRLLHFHRYNYTDNRAGAPSYYFALMLEGKAKLVTESETVTVEAGDVFYIPNKCSYRSYWYGEPNIRFISLGFLYLPNRENCNYGMQVLPPQPEATALFHKIAVNGAYTAKDIGTFYTLVGLLLPTMQSSPFSKSEKTVRKAERFLTENPYTDISALAKYCAVSESALYAAFQKIGEQTPNELRNRILLEKAKEVLLTTDKSVEEISALFRFSSPSYFRKKFKQQYGVSPKQMSMKYRI